MLIQPSYRDADVQTERVQEPAARLALELIVVHANSENVFEDAFATLAQRQAAALLISATPYFNDKRHYLAALAVRHKLPAMFELPEFTRLAVS